MKIIFTTLMALGFAAVCAGAPNAPSHKIQKKMSKILIVYYSWSGNTRAVAQHIERLTGGELFEIKPLSPYPSDYDACVKQAEREIKGNIRPELAQMPANVADYDFVFVGSPNWWGTIAPPVASFLVKAGLQGKTIVPFCTHGTGGVQNLFTDMAKLAPKSKFLKGFDVEDRKVGSAQPDIEKWVKGLGLK